MFAVLKTGGKQYRVESGDVLRVEKVAAEAGETVQFNEILMVGNNVGAPLVKDAGVQAEVIDQIKGEKTINFVKRRRKHSSKRTKGHRQQLTLVRITDILEKGADKSGVKAALNGSGFMSADMIERAANKGAPASKKAEAAAARASQPKKAAPKAAKPAAEKAAPKKAAPKKAAAKTDGADDLTRISGVGPVIVGKLHDLGVTTFAQIAAWTPADIADMDDKLNFKGRIDRDEWLKQAAEFAKG
ncbi:50S ribosomal protein L21 [Octadecabacter ascidiaceicola]|uniref:Large ribosomal subunit protein bL21 n=1 Tax=Octadecabacter ascidiaceicola TaxID=1655543 RepID=A0A238JKZ6_9RHOB|nr:50S ribosomal protein L21 [Octadecabacter ascidiaceicola]SMX31348.1 50S ribosomal protein L21 [Octadecabacter ascidiaceicola]